MRWLVLLGITGLLAGLYIAFFPLHLASVILGIRHRVPMIDTQVLAQRLQKEPGDVLIFDVRSEAEYRVSHLPGAIRISEGLPVEDLLANHPQILGGKTVVFYCSVGERSGEMGARLVQQSEGKAAGMGEIYNLSGGIFAWANRAFPLENPTGPVKQVVHPFSKNWGWLLSGQVEKRFD